MLESAVWPVAITVLIAPCFVLSCFVFFMDDIRIVKLVDFKGLLPMKMTHMSATCTSQ